jgi:hypothetical protein
MRELSKSRLEKWLIACWSLLFLWGWGDFCCRVLRDWHAMSSGARTNGGQLKKGKFTYAKDAGSRQEGFVCWI